MSISSDFLFAIVLQRFLFSADEEEDEEEGRRRGIDQTHPTRLASDWWVVRLKLGFHPTQRTQRKERKERNDMASLLDRPITAASDDGVCHWHAAKLW